MYYIKRRYQNWWEKYNYLIEAGFDVGVAISAYVPFSPPSPSVTLTSSPPSPPDRVFLSMGLS
jgi:hypothetical protein